MNKDPNNSSLNVPNKIHHQNGDDFIPHGALFQRPQKMHQA